MPYYQGRALINGLSEAVDDHAQKEGRRDMRIRTICAGALLVLLWAPGAMGMSVEGQVDLLLNSLRFDRTMNARLADGLKIGVVSLDNYPQGQVVATKAEQAFKTLAEKKFSNYKTQVVAIRGASPEALVKAMSSQELDLVFVCPSPLECLKSLLIAATSGKILVLACDAEGVRSGAALAVVDRAGRPRILLNVDAARRQGAKFKSSFMRMAECIDSSGELKAVYQHPTLVGKRKLVGDDPVYPKMARLAKKEATLVAKLLIAPDGIIRNVNFLKTDKLFENAVRKALNGWRFKPHHVAGRAVPTYTVMNFKFNLN